VNGKNLHVSAMVHINAREQICHPERRFHISIISGEHYRSIQYVYGEVFIIAVREAKKYARRKKRKKSINDDCMDMRVTFV
jgi:hypothetical protein